MPERLDGWKKVRNARYTPGADQILGESAEDGSHSFLTTERSFGDFLLEVDVKCEDRGNSGIQVRSHQKPNGNVFGYQIEIDPSKRAWSGGLYEEGRRGWLDNLDGQDAARASFRYGEWNRYRIECVGPWVRTWVNGVPAADWLDPLDVEGFIGLQVHGGKNTKVRWRGLRLQDLGTREWRSAEPGELVGDFALRGKAATREARVSFRVSNETRYESGMEHRAPGVSSNDWRWTVDVSDPAFDRRWKENGDNQLAICAYGARIAVHLNGRVVADLREAAGPLEGLLHTEGVEEIELLGPPR